MVCTLHVACVGHATIGNVDISGEITVKCVRHTTNNCFYSSSLSVPGIPRILSSSQNSVHELIAKRSLIK